MIAQKISLFPKQLFERYYSIVFRPIIVFFCLALCVAFGFLVSNDRFPFVVVRLGGLVVALICLYRTEWGLLLIFVSSIWLPIRFATGTQSPLVASLLLVLLLLVVWLMRMLLFEKRLRLLHTPVTTPLLLFGVSAVVSFIWSNLVPDARVILGGWWETMSNARFASLMVIIATVAAGLLVANNLHEEKWFRIIIAMFAAAAVHAAFNTLIEFSTGGNPLSGVPFIGTLNAGGLFRTWAVAISLGQAMFNRALPRIARALLYFAAAMAFYRGFFLGVTWVIGWLPILIVVAVLALLYSRKLFLAVLILMLLFVVIQWGYFNGLIEAESDESGYTRVDAWEMNLEISREHLFLGTGPAGYAAYYMTYIPYEGMATHNNYLDILSQFGVVGLGLIAWTFVAAGRTAVRNFTLAPRGSFLKGLTAGILAGFMAMVFAMFMGDWGIPFAYTQGIAGFDYTVWSWLFIGSIVAVDYLLKQRQQDAAATSQAGA